MARNRVQFQKGLSEAAFDEAYGTEEQCHAALVAWRWPDGFECPDCRGRKHCVVRRGTRRLFQCNACRKQTSVRAGTIFASSKLPLRLWFKTIYPITQSKAGVSSLELAGRFGVTQTAAWMMKHKLGQVMLGICQAGVSPKCHAPCTIDCGATRAEGRSRPHGRADDDVFEIGHGGALRPEDGTDPSKEHGACAGR
jgi:transposase-like protein